MKSSSQPPLAAVPFVYFGKVLFEIVKFTGEFLLHILGLILSILPYILLLALLGGVIFYGVSSSQSYKKENQQKLDTIISEVEKRGVQSDNVELSQNNVEFFSTDAFIWSITGTTSDYCIAFKGDVRFGTISYYDSQTKKVFKDDKKRGYCNTKTPKHLTDGTRNTKNKVN